MIVETAQENALELLRTNEAALHEIANVLQEAIQGEDVARILATVNAPAISRA